MIGKVIMEISNSEMKVAVQYYLNSDLFFSKHKVTVTDVLLKSNGRFTIRFQGEADPQFVEPKRIEPAIAKAASGDLQ